MGFSALLARVLTRIPGRSFRLLVIACLLTPYCIRTIVGFGPKVPLIIRADSQQRPSITFATIY